MQQVLIEFAADTSGMAPADKALAGLTDQEKKLADQSIKTNTAIDAQGKLVTETAKASTKSVQQLSDSFKNLDKAMIGGAYKKTFDDIRKNLNLTDKELKAFYQNIIKNSRMKLLDSNLAKQDFDALSQLVKSAQSALDSMGTSEDKVAEKSTSMRGRLKELKQELQNLEDQGRDNTAEFEQMQIEAGKLQDQIGDTNARIKALSSDTFAFDAIASGIQGVAGAFAIAQGAAALFGGESEEVQQALLKVNAAMAILQGLQTVQNVLQKQSAASIAVDLVMRRGEAAAITAQTVATEEGIVAQEGLNVAMESNPVGLILIGITALITALLIFGESEGRSAEATKKLNELLLQQYELSSDLNNLYPKLNQKLKENLELQLQLLQVQNASIADQLNKKKEIITVTKEMAEAEVKRLKDENGSLDENIAKLDKVDERLKRSVDARIKLVAIQKQLDAIPRTIDPGDEQTYNKYADLVKAKKALDEIALKEKSEEALKAEKATLEKIVGDQKAANEDVKKAFVDITTLSAEQIRKDYEDRLKSISASADAEVAIRKTAIIKNQIDSLASIEAVSKAERNAIRTKLNEELKTNSNLTEGERAKLVAEANLAIAENYKAMTAKILDDRKTGIKAELEFVKEGSKEELNLKLKLQQQEQEIELSANELTQQQVNEIYNRYLKQRIELYRAFNKQVAEDAINTQIAQTNSRISDLQIASASATNSELLRLKKDLIDEQASLEVLSIDYSEKNEELRRAKIQEIYAKALADKRKLEDDKTKSEVNARSGERTAKLDIAAIEAQIEAIKTGNKNKKKLRDIERQQIEEDNRHLNDLIITGTISAEDAEIKQTEIAKKQAALRLEIAQDEAEKKARVKANGEALFQNVISLIEQQSKAANDRELARVQDLYDRKLISEKEYQNRTKEIKRQQAIDEKKKAIFDVIVKQGPMLIQAFIDGGIIGEILAGALFASSLALVAAAPLPQFKKGKINIPGPGTTTSDSIMARISKGESVVNAKQTSKWEPALQAINNDTFELYLKNISAAVLPQMPVPPSEVLNSSPFINYDLMAKSIGKELSTSISKELSKELAANPTLMMQFNEDGFKKYLIQQDSITELKNRHLEL